MCKLFKKHANQKMNKKCVVLMKYLSLTSVNRRQLNSTGVYWCSYNRSRRKYCVRERSIQFKPATAQNAAVHDSNLNP